MLSRLCCPGGTAYAYADEHTRMLLKRRDETQKEIEMLNSSINSLETKLSVMSVDLQGHPLYEQSVKETVRSLVEEEKRLKRSNKTLKKLITAIEMDDPNYQIQPEEQLLNKDDIMSQSELDARLRKLDLR